MVIHKGLTARAGALSILAVSLLTPGTPLSASEPVPGEQAADAILVLDASGSMWGQIEGVNKIVIAKDVVEELVHNLPVAQRLGFVAYGHRRDGDCQDIETLAEVGAPRARVIEQLRSLSPRGKTPLTMSLQHAATALNYQKNAATVILVSDGLENCDADPCELARILEKNGLKFTVHVVGFDVTAQERGGLECIASETGGEFLAADSANELAAALSRVAAPSQAQESAPVPSRVVLKATILPGGPQIMSQLAWTVRPAAGGEPVFSADNTGAVETEILPGSYQATVVWRGWKDGLEKHGSIKFEILPQKTQVYTLPIDLGLPVTLKAPASSSEGQPIEISWSGPDDLGAVISVNRPDDSPSTEIFFFATQKARDQFAREANGQAPDTDGDGDFDQNDLATSKLAVPPVAGTYELRYTLNDPNVVLARQTLTVLESTYTLKALRQLPVSTQIDIQWTGPLTSGDVITLISPDDPREFDNARYVTLKPDTPVSLTTPSQAGEYEIRYVMHGGYTTYPGMQYAVKQTMPLVVTDINATVSGPASAIGGSTVKITWQGPEQDWEDDFISVVEPGAERYNRDSWVKLIGRDRSVLQPAPIRVPAVEGAYEVVYVIRPGDRIVARSPITISRALASVEAPQQVTTGQGFEVNWSGNAFAGDRVVLVEASTPDEKMWGVGVNYGFTVSAGTGTGKISSRLTAKPGAYEVRYVTGLQHQVLARAPVQITE